MSRTMTAELAVDIPMRDGVITRADIYRPAGDAPVPAILVRTPYDRRSPRTAAFSVEPLRATASGFAVAYQDTRGRFASEGDFYPYRFEAEDGYDSVEWLAAQPWCDGNVGMSGFSYLGAVQWLAASLRPPHLRALVPLCVGSEHYRDMMAYTGGAFRLGYLLWWTTEIVAPDSMRRRISAGEASDEDLVAVLRASEDVEALARHRPLSELPALAGNPIADYYFDWMLPRPAENGQPAAPRDHYGDIDVPALSISGWYDYFLPGTLENYVGMRRQGATASTREDQRLLIGPWDHELGAKSSEVDFGTHATTDAADMHGIELEHFARHLKGETPETWRVRIFVMGENVWRDEDDWPLTRARATAWYLHSDGDARGAAGRLSPAVPAGEPSDAYLYDPRDPAPTIGGAVGLPGLAQGLSAGPFDQRPAEARPDVLVYTSDALVEPLEVTGPLRATVYAATSAPDTDFVVRLCDVHEDGASRILAEGILRARFRDGYDSPSPVEPGRAYAYDIDLGATSNVFLPGHRLRVDVTSSSFPHFEPNPNTGNPTGQDGPRDLRAALQTVFHDAQRPSHIVVPVIPRT
jgi:putative CocE/NonD family hydrolase